MNIKISPVDVLFFRDSKPFGRGSEHFTRSIFPPPPQTLYGAIRTKVLEDLGCDYDEFKNGRLIIKNHKVLNEISIDRIEKEIGSVDKIGGFVLKGPFLLYKNNIIYLQIPADIKKVCNGNSQQYRTMQPFNWRDYGIEFDFEFTNYPHIVVDEKISDTDGYISLTKFLEYCSGEEITSDDIKKSTDVFEYEMRTGIGIDSQTNRTKEGLLYTMGFVRLEKDWVLCASIENLSILPEQGFIKWGGANRVCEYNKLPDDLIMRHLNQIEKVKSCIEKNRKLKIILLTPALFNKGWISDRFNENFELQFDSVRIKLISAAIRRPDKISGWDLARHKAKPLKRLVPAGSVYYFELLDGNVDDLLAKMNFINFSDENPNQGFGTILIGGIKNV